MSKLKYQTIVRLDPTNFTANVWGGQWIPRLKKQPLSSKPVGESWEFSLHPRHPSRILSPKGANLAKTIERSSAFLLKFLDARDSLSLQVHPQDRYARRVAGQSGKTESWIILDSKNEKGGGFLYLGFKPGGKKIRRALTDGLKKESAEKILKLLNKIRARPGEVYHVPAGTIHAVGRGIRLAEIQQSSDLTYRIWDWNRFPRRTLHLKSAFEVMSFAPRPPRFYRKSPRLVYRTQFVHEERLIEERKAGYAAHQIVWKAKNRSWSHDKPRQFFVLTGLRGRVRVSADKTPAFVLAPGHTAVVLKQAREVCLTSLTPTAAVLKSFIP